MVFKCMSSVDGLESSFDDGVKMKYFASGGGSNNQSQ